MQSLMAAGLPIAAGVRMFVAPVDRAAEATVRFDPALMGRFDAGAPPAGFVDAGVLAKFAPRMLSTVKALEMGSPMGARAGAREAAGAEVEIAFANWSRLAMALDDGGVVMNVLAPLSGADAVDTGAAAVAGVALLSGSTERVLHLPADAGFAVGDCVVVDVDYAGEAGWLGSGVSGTYVKPSATPPVDADYVRRVSFNVGVVVGVDGEAVTLSADLVAGVPVDGMKVQKVLGFQSRAGTGMMQEWSALFVMDGVDGDRALWFFPRLQPAGAAEMADVNVAGKFAAKQLSAKLRALPVTDAVDGEMVWVYRTYLPAAEREVLR